MKTIQLFTICLLSFNSLTAQGVKKKSSNTIENQLKKLYITSGTYKIYKVIKKSAFLNLQKNVLDSLSLIKKNNDLSQQHINNQNNKIISLQKTVNTLNTNLSISMARENSISLFGLQLKKNNYNSILWVLILILVTVLGFFIYKFKNNNILIKKSKSELNNIEMEFEEFRKKSLGKEQKLRRQLQDEINKKRGV